MSWFDDLIADVKKVLHEEHHLAHVEIIEGIRDVSHDNLLGTRQMKITKLGSELDDQLGRLDNPLVIEIFGAMYQHNMVRLRRYGYVEEAWIMNANPQLIASAILNY